MFHHLDLEQSPECLQGLLVLPGSEGVVGLGRQRLHAVLEAGEQVERRCSIESVEGERLAGPCGRVHGNETAERFAG